MASITSLWTRDELLEQIALCKKALAKGTFGHSYSIGSRSRTFQSLSEVRNYLSYLTGELAALEGRRGPLLVQGRINYGGRRS
jgi:hypothetical protein